VDLGGNQAGAHRVDADPVVAEFERHRQRQAVDRPLGGGVVGVLAHAAVARGGGRHVDDAAAPATVANRHPPHGLPGAGDQAEDVGPEQRKQVAGADPVHRCGGAQQAGVVDQAVESGAEPVDLLEEPQDLRVVADVGGQGVRPAAASHDLVDQPPGNVAAAAVVDQDRPALAGGGAGGGGADAPAAAGDEDGSGPRAACCAHVRSLVPCARRQGVGTGDGPIRE
jgi:hypothetical protein